MSNLGKRSIDDFRNGIFALRTRRFGTVAEIMVKRIFHLEDAGTLEYDKYDRGKQERIEVKFSLATKENEEKIFENNVLEQCIKANFTNRIMTFDKAQTLSFDCNIQQVKCHIFDILYYGLFFWDVVKIFRMTAAEILRCPGYSNKQHRYNGDGQFHLNDKSLPYYLRRHFVMDVSYEDLYSILQ